MSISVLLTELAPLLQAPDEHFDAIVQCLRVQSAHAEREVARFWASQHVFPILQRRITSPDPRVVFDALAAVPHVCTRQQAAPVLRALYKHSDSGIRARVPYTVRLLALDEVALRDTRVRLPRNPRIRVGGFNPTGWGFGLFADTTDGRYHPKKPKLPPRPARWRALALPALASRKDLHTWLGLDGEPAFARLLRPGVGPGAPYIAFPIPKATGGQRTITAPRAILRRVQRRILHDLLAKLPVHDACHGFVPGRSIRTNAAPHQGARLLIKLDVKDFFPTIHYRRVAGLFQRLGYPSDVAKDLAGLCTHRSKLPDGRVLWPGVLPQGAPTSPMLANLLCGRLDARLSKLATKLGGVYTRYADDLTFSFQAPPSKGIGRFTWWVDQILQQEGFLQNTAKRRILRPHQQQRVTGIVVNTCLSIPRKARRTFRALLHNCRLHGLASQARDRRDFRGYLLGFAAYVRMIQPTLGRALLAEVSALLPRG